MSLTLLTRDRFREAVFARDKHRCVTCGSLAKDAHHIMERRLFDDGGYYLDNGASLCSDCHFRAEWTVLTAQDIREAAGIKQVVLPPHLYPDQQYDKWGNILLSEGRRVKGELFFDESVQKALASGGVLDSFQQHVKYPRTYHLPWSPSVSKDDRVLSDVSHFEGKKVVVTVKMDGENTSMYSDYIHARSLSSMGHVSQHWIKNLHAQLAHDIPEGWRICGENLFAKHSIHYQDLASYFYVFSIWDERNQCLSWSETVEYAAIFDLPTVPVLYQGQWDQALIEAIYKPEHEGNECEGYVVRLTESFPYGAFRKSMAKFVRPDHIADTVHNWRSKPVVQNRLKIS